MRFFLIASLVINVILVFQVYSDNKPCPSRLIYKGYCIPEKWIQDRVPANHDRRT